MMRTRNLCFISQSAFVHAQSFFSNSFLPSESSGSSSAAPTPMVMEKEIDMTAKEKIPPQLGDTQSDAKSKF